MTKHELEYWQAITENSKYHWTEDRITSLNGNGALYYKGGESGRYIRISPDGNLSAGTYEDAFPHIGEACFTREAEHQYENFDEALKAACQLGGEQFLVDMFSDDGMEQTLAEPEEQDTGSFEMKM